MEAVDARPKSPQLYKIDPDFLDRFDKLERETKGSRWIEVRETVQAMPSPSPARAARLDELYTAGPVVDSAWGVCETLLPTVSQR